MSTKKYLGLEPALAEANKNHLTSCDRSELRRTRFVVEKVIGIILAGMKAQSATFAKLHVKNFGVGSIYEGTKVGKIDEFDMDLVLKMPELVGPVLRKDKVAGFVKFQLRHFGKLAEVDPEMHRDLSEFVDEGNYLLSEEFMRIFIQRILARAVPDRTIEVGSNTYLITSVQYIEPALTLHIQGPDLEVSVDLVASFLWPSLRKSEMFLAPARPIQSCKHKSRFWRLSFHALEREILYDRHWLKPAFRVLKQIRNHFEHPVHSYALKTLFLWELCNEDSVPNLWKAPLSYVVMHMLRKYREALSQGNVSYFWNRKFNLLSYLPREELEEYRQDIDGMLSEVESSPTPETMLKYLK